MCPAAFKTLNSQTPMIEPTKPPAVNTAPMVRSTLPRRMCASTPETEEATVCAACVPTATDGGTPMKISSGVIRKPPPTPNRPDNSPIAPPSPRTKRM